MTTTEQRPDTEQATEKTPFEILLDAGKEHGYKLDWLRKGESFGQKLEADLTKGGLLLQDIEEGREDDIPEHSENYTGRPRGAIERVGAPRIGDYKIRNKGDVWLRNAADGLSLDNHWQKIAVDSAVGDLYSHQALLTQSVLATTGKTAKGKSEDKIESWVSQNRAATDKAAQLLADFRNTPGGVDLAMLTVANAQLRALLPA